MTTTFDKKRDEAKHHLRQAIEALTVCSNPNTSGYEDLKSEYIDNIIDALTALVKAERKL